MRNAIILLCSFCCIAGFSCDHYCCAPPVPSTYMRAARNDTAWSIFKFTARITHDTLTISDTSVDIIRTEMIAFKFKFTGINNYMLTPIDVTYNYGLESENSLVRYTPDPDFNNSFNVTNYNPDTGFISGSFNIKLDKDPSNTNKSYPAYVSFLGGTFNIHLSK